MSSLAEFAEQIYLFHEKHSFSTIEDLFNKSSQFYFDKFNEIDVSDFVSARLRGKDAKEKKSMLLSWLKKMIIEINKILKKKSDNDISSPYNLFELLFNDNGEIRYKRMLSHIDRNKDFYRMRSTEKYEIYDRKGLFIISDDKEYLIGDYRFNPSGYACLYLAPNLFLAWEESRRPDFDKVNFARFRNTRSLEVIDLTIKMKPTFREDFLMAYITLLCCAKTNDGDKHHFQYAMPHLLMETLCHSQRIAESNKKPIIHGIKYLSSRRFGQKDFLFKDKNLCEAYVFPQQPHDSTKHDVCQFIADTFHLTEPRSFFLYKSHCLNFFNRTALVSSYQESLFHQLEEQTKKDEVQRYDYSDGL